MRNLRVILAVLTAAFCCFGLYHLFLAGMTSFISKESAPATHAGMGLPAEFKVAYDAAKQLYAEKYAAINDRSKWFEWARWGSFLATSIITALGAIWGGASGKGATDSTAAAPVNPTKRVMIIGFLGAVATILTTASTMIESSLREARADAEKLGA